MWACAGRLCDDPKCRGKLKDTLINFGEHLPEGKQRLDSCRSAMSRVLPTDTLDASFDHAHKAELCLAMGSSLTVTPAADVPEGRKFQHISVCTALST